MLPAGNHHVEIYETVDAQGTGAWRGCAVSRYEAHHRLARGEPVVRREGTEGTRFVMSLFLNDMVLLTDSSTARRHLYRVQQLSVVREEPDLVFRLHTAAVVDAKETACRIRSWGALKSCSPEKVTVDLLGRIYPCHD